MDDKLLEFIRVTLLTEQECTIQVNKTYSLELRVAENPLTTVNNYTNIPVPLEVKPYLDKILTLGIVLEIDVKGGNLLH